MVRCLKFFVPELRKLVVSETFWTRNTKIGIVLETFRTRITKIGIVFETFYKRNTKFGSVRNFLDETYELWIVFEIFWAKYKI